MNELTELRAGATSFASHGVSKLKVTKNGKPEIIKVPIKSISISDALAIAGPAPTPPGKKTLIGDDWQNIPDPANEGYVKAKREYDQDLNFAIMGLGLNIPVVDKDGSEAKSPQQKVDILKSMGFSGNHFLQLTNDINALTAFADGEAESLSSGSSAVPQVNSGGSLAGS